MPICRNCGDSFPNRMVIDGKQRILNKRKCCLKCSPFKGHNTRNYINPFGVDDERKCEVCEQYYVYNRKQGHRGHICNKCLQMIRRDKLKDKLVEIFGGCCIKCGYNKCVAALVFHHKGDNKVFQISGNIYNRSFDMVLEEAKKCDLLCSNCHREEHYLKEEKKRREKVKIVLNQSSTIGSAVPS